MISSVSASLQIAIASVVLIVAIIRNVISRKSGNERRSRFGLFYYIAAAFCVLVFDYIKSIDGAQGISMDNVGKLSASAVVFGIIWGLLAEVLIEIARAIWGYFVTKRNNGE